MHVRKEVLARPRVVRATCMRAPLGSSSVTAVSWLSAGSAPRGENTAYLLLWLPRQPQERGRVVLGDALATHAAASARREAVSRLPSQPGENKCVCSL